MGDIFEKFKGVESLPAGKQRVHFYIGREGFNFQKHSSAIEKKNERMWQRLFPIVAAICGLQ